MFVAPYKYFMYFLLKIISEKFIYLCLNILINLNKKPLLIENIKITKY